MPDPKSLAGRVLALGCAATMILAIWAAAVAPLLDAFEEQRVAIQRLERLLAAYPEKTGSISELRVQLANLETKATAHAGLMEGPTQAAAGAALQTAVRRIIETQGGTLRSFQTLPATLEDGLQKIPLRLDASIPTNALLDVIYEIETSRPYLFVENIELRVPEMTGGLGILGHRDLSLRAELYALARGAAK